MTRFSAPLHRQPALTEERESNQCKVNASEASYDLRLSKLLFPRRWCENEPFNLIYWRWNRKFMPDGDLWTYNKLRVGVNILWWHAVEWELYGQLILLVRRIVEFIPNGSLDFWIFPKLRHAMADAYHVELKRLFSWIGCLLWLLNYAICILQFCGRTCFLLLKNWHWLVSFICLNFLDLQSPAAAVR